MQPDSIQAMAGGAMRAAQPMTGSAMVAMLPDIAPELVLLVGLVVLLVAVLFTPRRLQRGAAPAALLILVLTAIATAFVARGGERLTFAGTYAADGAAVYGKYVILAAAALAVALSVEWFTTDPREGEYYVLLLMATLAAALMAGAADVMELIVGLLLSSVTGYVLTAYHRRSRRSSEAAIKYYLIGALTNALLVYAAALVFGLAGTTTYEGLAARLPAADAVPLVVAAGLFIIGVAFKVGAVPVHAWLPDMADGAPAPVAAFLTAAPKVGALIALARLVAVLPESSTGWRPVIAVLAAATMTLGNLAALWQDDVRRLLGWSAVSQSGYALMAVAAVGRSPLAVPALVYFLAAYMLGTIAAFGVVTELRGQADRAKYAGLATAHPWLAVALVVSFLSFVGIPPLAGFAGKLALYGAALDSGYAWLAVLAVINSAVSLFYYARILAPAYFEPAAEPLPVLGRWAGTATALAVAALVVLGIVANPLLAALAPARLLPR